MIDEVEPEEPQKQIEEEPRAEGLSESEETQQDLEEKEMEEQEKDAEYIASATRAPRQGTYKRFMVSSLASVLAMTDEVKRVKQICLAAHMVPKDERKELVIDYDLIEVLNIVANALLSPTVRRTRWAEEDIVSIPWGFSANEET
jgi:hypothetical protein